MRRAIPAAMAVFVFGTVGALAQATGEAPADPQIKQDAPSAAPSDTQPKARLPMRREQPIVPDPTAPASEGAGAGTSGSDLPSATPPAPAPAAPEQEKKY